MANVDTNAYLEDAVGGPNLSPLRVFRYAISTNPTADDHHRFFKLPKNVKIGFAQIASTDLDTHATPTIDFDLLLTDGTTEKILIEGTANLIGQTGGVDNGYLISAATNEPGFGFVTTSHDWYVAVDFKAAAATFASGTIIVSILYTTVLDDGA